MELLNKVIVKITPKDTSVKKEIDEIVSSINKELKKNKIKAIAVIGGSFAKDTHLVDDHDCDIFVKFDYKHKDKPISDLLQKSLKSFKPNRLHGSRDYFQFSKKLNYEIVPVLDIKKANQALNVTDVSPLHVSWTRKHKKGSEIRLAKAFCKSAGIYGAESYIKGFSGHVLDILTIYYGSFMNLLKASQKWKESTVIDVEKYYKNSKDALFEINKSKTQSPLIVVDPIQKERNAAAALSNEKFDIFIKKAKEFLKNPNEKYFERKVLTKNDFKYAIILDVKPLLGKRDVVGAKIMKTRDAIKRELENHEFNVKDSGFVWDKETFIWFRLKNDKVEPEKVIKGPPLALKEHVAAFKKAHKNSFEKNARVFARIKVGYVNAKDLIKDVIKTEEIREKVKSISF